MADEELPRSFKALARRGRNDENSIIATFPPPDLLKDETNRQKVEGFIQRFINGGPEGGNLSTWQPEHIYQAMSFGFAIVYHTFTARKENGREKYSLAEKDSVINGMVQLQKVYTELREKPGNENWPIVTVEGLQVLSLSEHIHHARLSALHAVAHAYMRIGDEMMRSAAAITGQTFNQLPKRKPQDLSKVDIKELIAETIRQLPPGKDGKKGNTK